MGEKAESKISYGNQRVFAFDPGQISMESTTAGLRDDFNLFATEARKQYRDFKSGVRGGSQMTVEDMIKARSKEQQAQREAQDVFDVKNPK